MQVKDTEPFGHQFKGDDGVPVADTSSAGRTPVELADSEDFIRLLGILQRRNERLAHEVEEWQARFAAQETRIAELHDELELVFRTRSWRLTVPLRWVQESLARSNSVLKLRTIIFVRRFFPRAIKNGILGILGQSSPPAPTKLFGPALPTAEESTQWAWNPQTPIVSVIIPCFNYGQYLDEAVESVLNQQLQDAEIIVVDDGSTDELTRTVLANLHRPRTRVIHQENAGLSAARNAGIREARGKYICCLDADDLLEPTYLEKAVAMLESNHGVSFVYPWVRLFGDEERVWRTEPFDLRKLLRYNHVAVSAVFKKADWEVTGGFSPELRAGFEDWEFWIRLGEAGRRGRLIPEPLICQRRHGRTMTHSADDQRGRIMAEIRAQHVELFVSPERSARIQAAYVDRPVDEPLLNLIRPSQYRRSAAPGLLLLLPWVPAGGAETVAYEITNGVQRHSLFECTIVTSVPSENAWHDRFYDLTSRIYHLPNFLLANAWEPFVLNLIQSRDIRKVLISASEFAYSILPQLKKQLPDVEVFNLLHNDSDLGYFRHSVQYDKCIKTHIAVSNVIGNKLCDVGGINPGKVRVIYNGIDERERFNPSLVNREHLHEYWDIPSERPVITFCGRLSAEKQPLEFLRIAAQLQNCSDATFVVIGDGPLSDQVQRAIDTYGLTKRVRWWRGLPPEQIPELLCLTDVLAITSVSEGFPVVMLEALSMGVAVVTYDVGDVRTAISNGINGWVIPPNDSETMRLRLADILSDPAVLKKVQSRTRESLVERGLTRDVMIANYLEVLGIGEVVAASAADCGELIVGAPVTEGRTYAPPTDFSNSSA